MEGGSRFYYPGLKYFCSVGIHSYLYPVFLRLIGSIHLVHLPSPKLYHGGGSGTSKKPTATIWKGQKEVF